ncbi:hypothetical protein COOONC_04522, partial [Cooperia oncophora]
KRGSGLHIAADGSYDSRGYSAEIGKVVVADQCTKLIMHSEVLDRSQCDNHSPRRALHWLIMQGLEIASLTTDRSRSFGCVLDEVERVHGTAIEHYFDGWHLVKWLGNELRYTRIRRLFRSLAAQSVALLVDGLRRSRPTFGSVLNGAPRGKTSSIGQAAV